VRSFIIGVSSSVVAAIILSLLPYIQDIITDCGVFLDVNISETNIANIYVTTITAINSSKYGISEMNIMNTIYGDIIVVGVDAKPYTVKYSWPIPGGMLWSGSVASGEDIKLIIISNGEINTIDLSKTFEAKYLTVNSRGLIDSHEVSVRSYQDAQYEKYKFYIILFGLIALLVGVSVIVFLIRRYLKRRGSRLPTHP